MTCALDTASCRKPPLRRWGAVLALLAMLAHMVAMGAAHRPAAAEILPPEVLASICITSGEAPHELPGGGPDAGGHQGLFCPVCQSLHAGGYAPHSPVLAGPAWVAPIHVAPVAAPPRQPRLVLTELNPRGPPSSV